MTVSMPSKLYKSDLLLRGEIRLIQSDQDYSLSFGLERSTASVGEYPHCTNMSDDVTCRASWLHVHQISLVIRFLDRLLWPVVTKSGINVVKQFINVMVWNADCADSLYSSCLRGESSRGNPTKKQWAGEARGVQTSEQYIIHFQRIKLPGSHSFNGF